MYNLTIQIKNHLSDGGANIKKSISILLLVLVLLSFNGCFLFEESSSPDYQDMERQSNGNQQASTTTTVEVKAEPKVVEATSEPKVREIAKPVDPIVGLWQSIYNRAVTVEFTADGKLIFRTDGEIDRKTTYGYANQLLHVDVESNDVHSFSWANDEHSKLYIDQNFIKGEGTSRFVRLR